MNKLGTRKRVKMQRALGLDLPGLGKPGALEKRNYPPGQHGRKRKRKVAGFGLELREKQKLLFHYGLREEQLRRFVRMAKRRGKSDWMEELIGLLELRLDNIVFRLGFGRSISAARQLVSHGHVMVNGKKQTISSMTLRVGARIGLTEKANQLEATKYSRGNSPLTPPSYLQVELSETKDEGVIVARPDSSHLPFEFNKALVVEYYAKRGV